MRTLLTLLEAIERVCTHEKGKPDEKSEKSSFNGKKGKKRPGTDPMARVPKKVQFDNLRRIATCVRNMGAHIPLTQLVNVVSMRKTELKNLVSAPLRRYISRRLTTLAPTNKESAWAQ